MLRRRLAILLAALLIVLGGVNGPGAAASGPAQPDGTGREFVSFDRAAVEDTYRLFQSEAIDRGAMGFYRDQATDEMVVTIPAVRAEQFVLPAGDLGVPVRVRVLPIDPERVAQALDVLERAGPGLTAANDGSYTFRFDPEAGKVVVKGNIDREVMLEILADLVDVVDYYTGFSVVPTSRNWMAAPFSGGAEAKRVGSTNAFDCSTGFTVRKTSNGLRYMLTAGHCGALNSSWISPGSGYTIGVMRYRQLGPTDVALLGDKTYQPVIYTGGSAGVASTVKGASNPVLNNPIYCVSGAKTYEHCDLWVVSMTTGNCYSGGCYTNQMTFKKGGSCPTRPGDSGAPFYLDFNSGGFPYIRGIGTASLSDNSECYGEYWSRLSGAMGVTIVSG